MKLALKIDVATLRGTRDGVPGLVDVLQRHGAGATIVFAMGPDQGARGLRRIVADDAAGKPALDLPRFGLHGWTTLLPGKDIGRRARDVMRAVAEAGFETGIHCYDTLRWTREARGADAEWTQSEMQRAIDRYVDVFGERPTVHAAAGWQTNRHALRLTQRLGFAYASDGRGAGPYLPVIDGELVRCPQLPTTLPTLDELAAHGIAADALALELLALTADASSDHVFTLRAEIEGMTLIGAFEQLVLGWQAQGYEIVPLRALYDALEPYALPRCEVGWSTVAGRRTTLMMQGAEFLADAAMPRAA
jgi:undecaprenyl phosphate-alpha-L-ara4FN deformylase